MIEPNSGRSNKPNRRICQQRFVACCACTHNQRIGMAHHISRYLVSGIITHLRDRLQNAFDKRNMSVYDNRWFIHFTVF